MNNLNEAQEKARILHQRKNEEEKHKEAMAEKQANYQIEENNRYEERKKDKQIQCAKIVKS